MTELDDNRLYLQRRNGAGPGRVVGFTAAASALKRAADRGQEIHGDLTTGHASWHDPKLDADFTYDEITAEQANALSRPQRDTQ